MLGERGVSLDLTVCGAPEAANPDSVSDDDLREWRQLGNELPGHIADVRTVWGGADIAVVPTLGGEGIPRALPEAAECTRPIVASNVSGCKHFIRDGVEGLLVPPGDPVALAAALERLVLDADPSPPPWRGGTSALPFGSMTEAVRTAIREAYMALVRQSAVQ